MLSVLRSQIGSDIVCRFDYRNLAPLYVDEVMNVCVQHDKGCTDPANPHLKRYDVWIEGSEGGYAVKGTAWVGPLDSKDSVGSVRLPFHHVTKPPKKLM